ncbi:4'-phosphopantetheinyl transferase family protein [Streptomyces paludis]|uniref:4'-phosphopantetheinyl transferase domain-containing protein n=1 Tax=Streptomyces paludis TaxID=2282738 RepID=A0A345HT41_9ACTN|nr:4'-phosphopantetheinyl transferase superfamily protein [Streptomyces paludis]AXG79865.1 hypothetical protein DVK44_21895 [Streptomyces paludis]
MTTGAGRPGAWAPEARLSGVRVPGADGVRLRLAGSRVPLPEADLTEGEAAQAAALNSPARRRSWLTARRALRRALTGTRLPQDTSGYTFPHRVASLSYARDHAVAAVAEGDTADVRGLGVDVETGDPPAPDTARLFLGARELSLLGTLTATERAAECRRMWTVKEALFKADAEDAVFDLRRYVLDEPGARHGVARRAGSDIPAFRYLTLELPTGALSVALKLSPR